MDASASSFVADRTEFWWNERKPKEPTLWKSKIYLSEAFFNEIIRHPVPIDMNTLTALKRCSLGLDLYLWLVYRTFALKRPLQLSWRLVYRQFGAHPVKAGEKRTVLDFRRKVFARVEEDQDRLAGVELLHGSGSLDPLTLNTGHRSVRSKPASKLIFPFQPLTASAAASKDCRATGLLKTPPGASCVAEFFTDLCDLGQFSTVKVATYTNSKTNS